MTSLWCRLVLRADEWLTSYIRKAVPAAHHIGYAVSPDQHPSRVDELNFYSCCHCCSIGDLGVCDQFHRTPCDRSVCDQAWLGPAS